MRNSLFGGIILVFTTLFISGCSGDSDSPTNQDNLNDPEFEYMDEFLGVEMHNLNFLELEKLFIMIGSIASNELPKFVAKTQFDAIYISSGYTEDNGWYVFDDSIKYNRSNSEESDSLIYSGMDSLGFYSGNSLMSLTDLQSIDSIVLHNAGIITLYDSNALLDMDVATAFTITTDNSSFDYITLNGNAAFDISGIIDFGGGSTCNMNIGVTVSYFDLKIDWTGELFPYEGTASTNTIVAMECESDTGVPDIVGTWIASWTLENDSVTTIYNRGNETWTYTESIYD